MLNVDPEPTFVSILDFARGEQTNVAGLGRANLHRTDRQHADLLSLWFAVRRIARFGRRQIDGAPRVALGCFWT
jgi:hypothetical protein